MKRYNELTHEELIALKEEGVERLIDIEMAHAGIMPVACPAFPTLEAEGIVASEIAYEVGELLLKNESDAIAVENMETYCSNYDYHIGGYDYRWLEPIVNQTITKRMFYKKTDIARIKEVLQRNKTKREEYEMHKKKYDSFLTETGKIRDSVYKTYHAALVFQGEIDDAKALLEKYRNLADGNEEVAVNFFRNTYKSREDIVERVLETIGEVAK